MEINLVFLLEVEVDEYCTNLTGFQKGLKTDVLSSHNVQPSEDWR